MTDTRNTSPTDGSPIVGGRSAALAALHRIDPVAYGQTRNHLDGAVTRLSPYLRHGVLTLAEVRRAAIARAGSASRCAKLIQELAWRDYFQRVWSVVGDEVWEDLEAGKTGIRPDQYADTLPSDLIDARTGIDYVDHFVRTLYDTGYLHNHARMWLAAYIVHGRRVAWQAGAAWFLSHLLDGDEASNNLSWQWCAGTFSNKPYLFNRENVLKHSDGRFAAHQRHDPFDRDYASIADALFGHTQLEPEGRRRIVAPADAFAVPPKVDRRAFIWVHDGMLSPTHPALRWADDGGAIAGSAFVWDDAYSRRRGLSTGRLRFQSECAAELSVQQLHTADADLADVVVAAARQAGAEIVVTGATPDPRLRRAAAAVAAHLPVVELAVEPFAVLSHPTDVTRFSRYWGKVERQLLR
jgi:deoxyribodipyrimidine photo-lyase